MLVQKNKIVFLVRIRKEFSSLSNSSFLNAFSYSIYDFLQERKCFEKYAFLYGQDLYSRLVEVEKESMTVEKDLNGHKTKEFFSDCLSGKYDYFIRKELRQFLEPFLFDLIKPELDLNDSPNYLDKDERIFK